LGTHSLDDFTTGRYGLPGRPFVFDAVSAEANCAVQEHRFLTCGDICRACIR
jgi:hypothetical protein